jgi:hypothetical protein
MNNEDTLLFCCLVPLSVGTGILIASFGFLVISDCVKSIKKGSQK